jgi:hypothetical protein
VQRPVHLLLGLVVGAGLLISGPLSRGARAEDEDETVRVLNEAYPAVFKELVNEAIADGAAWLLSRQKEDGSWDHPANAKYPMGPTALCTLALLKAGVAPDDDAIERAFAYMRKLPLAKTYSVSILLMALDARYAPVRDTFRAERVDRYGHRLVERDPCASGMTPEDLAWMKAGVAFLVRHQHGGHWRYPSGGFDLSNTQYALLGLKAASRCGVDVPPRVWLRSLEFLLDYQQDEGEAVDVRGNEVRGEYRVEWKETAEARGFPYRPNLEPTGSMTTAGVAGLIICQSELWESRKFKPRLRRQTRDAIRDGFAWMQVHFDVTQNPNAGNANHYYYLYGLERMGILARTRFVGEFDWYLDGAQVLLSQQASDGSWWNDDVVQTSFAILFLKRATFRTRMPAITPPDQPLAPSGPR